MDLIISLLSILVVVILGYITYRIQQTQIKLQKSQFKFDMYKVRVEYYRKLRKISSCISDSATNKWVFSDFLGDFKDERKKLNEYYDNYGHELKFIFGTEVYQKLKDLRESLNSKYSGDKKNEIIRRSENILYEQLLPAMEKQLTNESI